ncbi:hypothetical protein D910_07476 [Dendroctonus ponderosae]|uniref:Potassium channel domain-containing protein n=2 Tax=Dendroctonus ponderosae TaxID=77166 RepID=U4TSC1_DENPD|nr:hypothetical protein D910_00813 [Dendroctonus ponderosae]ERL90122.1 hypothetical protein D910_07476 [Dendroctonus ponderosae]
MEKTYFTLELQQQLGLQEPFYVRSNSSYSNNIHSPCRDSAGKEIDSLSGTDNESKSSIHGWSILAPILLCLVMMFIYICIGTFVLYKLENWSLLDGFYFCFMSLTTIGFGNMVPGSDPFPDYDSSTTLWFCSIYIMSGMALTAMSFNVVHDEIVHRNLTEETLLSTGTPTSVIDLGHELVPVTVGTKMPEVIDGSVLMTGVYTLPEEPENEENSEGNTQM